MCCAAFRASDAARYAKNLLFVQANLPCPGWRVSASFFYFFILKVPLIFDASNEWRNLIIGLYRTSRIFYIIGDAWKLSARSNVGRFDQRIRGASVEPASILSEWLSINESGVSGNDFLTFGNGNGNGSTHSQTLGTGTGMKNCIPNFWEREREWKFHSHFLGTGTGMEIPFPNFGNGNETLLFPGMTGNGNIIAKLSEHFL